jgi:6-phosphogluconolactonase/glucosamine-6-phosphate isomerase/deaminase
MLKIQTHSHPELQIAFWSEWLRALDHLSSQEEIYVGLSGGSSLDIYYGKIRADLHSINPEIRSRLRFCLLDERIVAEDHPDSNL